MKKIDLYRITTGTRIWTLTSSNRDETYNGEKYLSIAMNRTKIEQKAEISKASLEVNIPIDHELAIFLLTTYSEQIISMTMFTRKIPIIGATTTSIGWKGRLVNYRPGDANLTMVFESLFTSLRRPGLRARFQKSCRHALYGKGCELNAEDLSMQAVISSSDGVNLTINFTPPLVAPEDGYFIGGMIKGSDGVLSYVINHVGDQIKLQRANYRILQDVTDTGSSNVTIYPGCDHSRMTCLNKFDNLMNYGGFDWIPDKNPMGGSSII